MAQHGGLLTGYHDAGSTTYELQPTRGRDFPRKEENCILSSFHNTSILSAGNKVTQHEIQRGNAFHGQASEWPRIEGFGMSI